MTLMFIRRSIVINMHKRVMFFLIFFTLNDLKQKIKVKLNYRCGNSLTTR